jgi:2-polyprenyl-6-methoxyphenol hydroxylase-like FAD-dependent oxidoreductase
MNQKPQKPFRVVVIGGGIAGLTMSHCLQKAGIDHVVLEAHPLVAAPVGASIGFWPHGMRILDQLGCGKDMLHRSEAMVQSHCRMPDGKALSSTTLWDYIQAR